MTHTAYLQFSFNLKIISLISPHLISLLLKNVLKNVDSLNFTEFSKKGKKMGDCLVPKIVQGENIHRTVLSIIRNERFGTI